MTTSETRGPLAGIRVLDLATARGELAGTFLGDLGASVTKMEPPGGAEARRLPPFDGAGRSLFWEAAGRGKHSVIVDLDDPAGRAMVLDFAATCDVVIESSEPGEMNALELGYGALSEANPRLIYVSITPYGQTGPKAHLPASDTVLQAAGGLVSLQGDWDRRPLPIGEPYTATYHAGAQAAADTIIALNERERSGRGQHLDVSMQSAIVWILMNATGFPPNEGRDPPGFGDERGQRPMSAGAALLERAGITVEIPSIWECADGYVSALLLPSEARAHVFADALAWADEEGAVPEEDRDLLGVNWGTYVADVEAGRLTQDVLARSMAAFGRLFLRVTKREVMERSIRDNLFFAPIYTPRDLVEDPHLDARDFWRDVGGVRYPGRFAVFSGTPMADPVAAAALGASEVRAEVAVRGAAEVAVAQTTTPRARPFEGLKVADFAWIGVGPLIAKALADHGATVVHVESETRPDTLRNGAPFKGGVQDRDLSQFFANFNSSKLGLGLNFARPEGRAIARKLIDWADVVVESFTPGTMAKFGLDYATISRERPELVMLSTCLRGQTGPEATLAGFGTSGAALSGLHATTGWPDRAPIGPWGAYTDFITPRLGVAALSAALYHRQKTGRGQHVDVSQVECGIHFLTPEILEYELTGRDVEAPGDASPLAFPNGIYQVEGAARYIALSVTTAGEWRALRALAFPDEFAGAEFEDMEARRAAGERIDAALRAWLQGMNGPHVVERLTKAGIPAAMVARPSDLHRDEQLAHREFFTVLDHTRMGPTPYDGFVTRFSAVPSGPRAAAPCLGEHTEYVLREFLGMDEAEVREAEAADLLR